jgi:PBSX family phage portal protein
MAAEDKQTAQVYKFTALNKADNTPGRLLKDLGPGGYNPEGNAVQPNAFEPEDEYQQLYVGATRDQGIVQPPYVLRTLDRLSQENNTLGPCIEAMVTNIDGTGYSFEADDEEADDKDDDTKIDALTEFFAQPWPGMSFTTIRKKLRRDLHRTGNAYIEILRNPQDEIVFFRWVDAKMMRMLRLDDAVPVDQTVIRGGKPVTIKTMTRERRYCQLVNGVSLMYFKEFGSKRDLHKKTAVWAPQGQRLPANMRGTEIMHFITLPDSHTPYGIPLWVNQTPSVLGSRKAEEFNLEFFDNGGVPPVMILLQGGTLQAETRKAIEQMSTGEARRNNRMRVLEVEPSGGSLENTPQARVTVERFGSERQADSMFEKYDEKCELRVRRSFRLPPIFVGQAGDYSFATAFASYTVAEAQVFKPERDEFDEMISVRLLPSMGFDGYSLRSKPLVIEDATLKLQGIEVAMGTNQVEMEDVITEVNDVTGTHLKVSTRLKTQQVAEQNKNHNDFMSSSSGPQGSIGLRPGGTLAGAMQQGAVTPLAPGATQQKAPGSPPPSPGPGDQTGKPVKSPAAPPVSGTNAKSTPVGAPARKAEGMHVAQLALETMTAMRKRDYPVLAENLEIIGLLDEAARGAFDDAVAQLSFVDASLDPDGLKELAGCALAVMAGHHHDHSH